MGSYIDVTARVSIRDVISEIDTESLIEELADRRISDKCSDNLKEIALDNCKWGEFENLQLNPIDEMKVRYFLSVMDKYTIEEIETLLSKK